MHGLSLFRASATAFVVGALSLGCGGSSDNNNSTPGTDGGVAVDAAPPQLAPELGTGDHSVGSVTLTPMVEGLRRPTGIAFNPERPTQFWVTNWATDAFTIVDTAGEMPAEPLTIRDRSYHFLVYPTSLAFGGDGTVGTCQESANDYRGRAMPNNFMGPVVHTTDIEQLRTSRGPSGTHLDMLHHTPFCMGIASPQARQFWVFNGAEGAIDKYEFGEWHAPGADDHSDGLTWRFAAGSLRRVENVPSHLVYDAASRYLYIADSGNHRVVRLNTAVETTTDMERIRTRISETPLYNVEGSTVEEVVGQEVGGLDTPSGIALRNGFVYVSDWATGRISAFRMTNGERVNYLETGLTRGALAGIAFGPDNKLYVIDASNPENSRVVRIDP